MFVILFLSFFVPASPQELPTPVLSDLNRFPPQWLAKIELDAADRYEEQLNACIENLDYTSQEINDYTYERVRNANCRRAWSALYWAQTYRERGDNSLALEQLTELQRLLDKGDFERGAAGIPWVTDAYGRLFYGEAKGGTTR